MFIFAVKVVVWALFALGAFSGLGGILHTPENERNPTQEQRNIQILALLWSITAMLIAIGIKVIFL